MEMNGLLWINLTAFLLVTAYAAGLFVYLIRTRIAYIKLGKKVEFDNRVKDRLVKIGVYVFGQKKLFKDKKSGIIHAMLFYGFILVQFGALDFFIKGLKPGWHLPFGPVYPAFTFFQEIVTLTVLVAILWAAYRRYVEKLVRLKRDFKAGLVVIFITGIMITVLLGNGMGMIWHGHEATWSEPVASSIAYLFGWMGPTAATVVFYVAWWMHLLIILSFLVYIPQSKHAHLIAGPINVFLNRLDNPGKLKSVDLEEEVLDKEGNQYYGAKYIEDLTQYQMVDLYACVECGRCTNMCPATGTGKMLSPMDIIIKMRDHLTNTGAAVTTKQPWVPSFVFGNSKGNKIALASATQGAQESAAATEAYSPSLIGEVITEEELWACTTCRNCEDQCPVMNEHVDKIIDMRRYLVLTEGRLDSDAQRAMTNIERQGNPWGLNRKEREDWRVLRDDVNIPTVKELQKADEEFEYLFWVGSMGSYDNRSQKIALSFAKLMNEAGIKFAILGNKEKNSGDTPRRLGNEFVFQELAMKNIEEFQKNEIKKIVTIDPHAYNIFKNEYPDFGLEAEVYHHTELLAKLVSEGRLVPQYPVNETITFHDSCYLGRYNDVYSPPREILQSIEGVKLIEMERNREKGMCCGAGGGLMWMEEETGNRINVARTEQALAVNPTVISSGCPYCLTMLSDGTKAKEVEENVKTYDVAELLEKAVIGENKSIAS